MNYIMLSGAHQILRQITFFMISSFSKISVYISYSILCQDHLFPENIHAMHNMFSIANFNTMHRNPRLQNCKPSLHDSKCTFHFLSPFSYFPSINKISFLHMRLAISLEESMLAKVYTHYQQWSKCQYMHRGNFISFFNLECERQFCTSLAIMNLSCITVFKD